MSDVRLDAVCGVCCDDCSLLGKQCAGCAVVAGRPFWTAYLPSGLCPIYDCCTNQRHLEHCGLCSDLPCSIFLSLRDPELSDEAFQASLAARQGVLRRRVEEGR